MNEKKFTAFHYELNISQTERNGFTIDEISEAYRKLGYNFAEKLLETTRKNDVVLRKYHVIISSGFLEQRKSFLDMIFFEWLPIRIHDLWATNESEFDYSLKTLSYK